MKLMAVNTLHEGWSALTGAGSPASQAAAAAAAASAPSSTATTAVASAAPPMEVQSAATGTPSNSNLVPLLMQDPFNVMLSHFLLLPFNVDSGMWDFFLLILTLTQGQFSPNSGLIFA